MPRNGAGTYTAPPSTWNPGVNGVTATTADYNAQLTDLSAAITQSVSKDGQTPMTGNLPMGNNKVTGLANGTATTDAAAFGQLPGYGCPQTSVELVYASTTTVFLRGNGGGYLWINGVNYSIGAGIIKTLPTLTTLTVYNVYAFWTGSAIDLEFSTTAFVSTSNGITQKSGDATRTLVGRIRTNSTTTTYDTGNDSGVVSYWNRRRRAVTTSIQTNVNTGSITDVGVLTGPTFISWGDEVTDLLSTAINGNSLNQAQNITTVYVNGAALSAGAYTSISGNTGIGGSTPRISSVVASGYVTTALFGRVNQGIGTWYPGSDMQAVFFG